MQIFHFAKTFSRFISIIEIIFNIERVNKWNMLVVFY